MNTLTKIPPAYKKLVSDITRFYENARRTVAKVYWHTGRRIVEVEQDGAIRARYGEKLLEKLSEDLSGSLGPGFSVQNLRKMRRVYLASRKRPTSVELAWSQQVELLPVGAAKLRERLAKKAVREGLTSRQIRALVRGRSHSAEPLLTGASSTRSAVPRANAEGPLLVPLKGKMGVYRIVKAGGKLHWDKGFSAYRELSELELSTFRDGDFVRRKGREELEKMTDGKVSDLYTYDAELVHLIDADTFWLKVWTAPPDWRKEKLRLRGIDAPELGTPEGEAAKRFVAALFQKAQAITVTTTKPDKFHRYLSDVFLAMADGKEIFLNNFLLEKGYAVRADKIPASEWEKE